MIARKTFIQICALVLCLPIGEAYGLFRTTELRERCWFIASTVKQDIEWYIKDSGEAIIWIVFLSIWYWRERNRSVVFSYYIAAFLAFRISDLALYWYNHRAASGGYVACYVLILFSLVLIYLKNERKC